MIGIRTLKIYVPNRVTTQTSKCATFERSESLVDLYWLATSGGRFLNILFSCNRHIVLSDSIFWFNKLGVNIVILLVYFFNRL